MIELGTRTDADYLAPHGLVLAYMLYTRSKISAGDPRWQEFFGGMVKTSGR